MISRFPSGVIVRWQLERDGRPVEVAVEGRLKVNDPELAIKAALDGVEARRSCYLAAY
jgi:hypothetical protein